MLLHEHAEESKVEVWMNELFSACFEVQLPARVSGELVSGCRVIFVDVVKRVQSFTMIAVKVVRMLQFQDLPGNAVVLE